ncbi:MAG: ATP-binding protein [Betaproteobacteria bacterium]
MAQFHVTVDDEIVRGLFQRDDGLAFLDRVTHRCHIIEHTGESYRFRESLRRNTGGSNFGWRLHKGMFA